jgi:uncharacterized integral membrane protein
MRALYWLLAALLAIVLTLFAVSNRQGVSLALWPLPFVAELPLYLLILLVLLAGIGLGAAAAWIGASGRRARARQARRRVAALERELAATQSRLDPPSEPARR